MCLAEILEMPLTRIEIENELFIVNNRLKSATGEVVVKLKAKKLDIETRLHHLNNPDEEIIIDSDESHRTVELDTYNIATLEMNTIGGHKFSSSLYREKPNENIPVLPPYASLFPFPTMY